MSGSVPPMQQLPPPTHLARGTQSQVSVLGPGIAGIFIQGIETGLVFAQFSQWLSVPERSESPVLSVVVIFVTVVGLAQSGICFASAWNKYVEEFGMALLPDWEDYVQPLPTLFMSIPVQAMMIRRCYYLVNKNMFIITPLVLLLVASIGMTLWLIVSTFRFYTIVIVKDPLLVFQISGFSWPFLISVLLPAVLDLALSGILLHSLTQTMKQVYATHTRKRISRLVNIIWQSALPPTLYAVCVSVFYAQFARQNIVQFWMTTFQQMTGKLYVLSMFYMINAQPLRPGERPTTFMSTLTVPAEAIYTFTGEALERDVACSDIAAERGPTRIVDFAV